MAKRNDTITWMTDAIAKASRSENFSAHGIVPAANLGLQIEGVGPIKLPITAKVAKQLVAIGKVTPYGKGTKTLVDKQVRNSYELDADMLQFSDEWNQAIDEVTRSIAVQLGVPEDQLQANPYKLLLYERGGHFLPHRDSEKLGRMIGSLVVVLPTNFSGGELVLRHESTTLTFPFADAAKEQAANYIAFYADCEHEVRKVSRGRRLALTYNLTLNKSRTSKSKPTSDSDAETDALAQSINSWIAARPGEPLVFALEHQYTERGLKVDLLKGADRSLAKLVFAAAEQSNCRVHLAQVTRHLMQYADDGSFGRRGRWAHDHDVADLEIGEVYEDDLTGDFWVNAAGKRQQFGSLPLCANAIVSSTPLDQWKPTSEEYEGYTGNAGNTIDRWYHRSVLVVWHDTHHFDVMARSGAAPSIKLFLSMMKKLEKTPETRLESAREDCLRLAKAIINRWPNRFADHNDDKKPWLDDFATELLALDDITAIREFLSAVARQDKSTSIDNVVLTSCRNHGVDSFAEQLEELLRNESKKYRREIALRDFKWLNKICCDRQLNEERDQLQRLCSIAADRFCESFVQDARPGRFHRIDTSVSSKSLPLLVKSLVATEASTSLERLIKVLRSAPESFPLESVQVPCLNSVVPWAKKRDGEVKRVLKNWLTEVRRQLDVATKEEPSPPSDWTRPATVTCDCRYCEQLNQFLRDPEIETTRIAAPEYTRNHLESSIRTYRCDASHKLERKGRPYSLVLTKTSATFERDLNNYATNVKMLASLREE